MLPNHPAMKVQVLLGEQWFELTFVLVQKVPTDSRQCPKASDAAKWILQDFKFGADSLCHCSRTDAACFVAAL